MLCALGAHSTDRMLCALGAHSTDRMLCALGAHSKLKIPFDKTSTIIMQNDNMDGNNAL